MSKRLELEHLVSVRPVGPGNWSRDGRNIAFVWANRSGVSQLWVCSSEGGWPRRLTERRVILEMHDGTDRRDVWGGPQWSPDGSRIVFTSTSSFRTAQPGVWSVSLDGIERELTRHDGEDRTPRWSPTGDLIAFVGHRNGRDDIQIVPAEGGVALQLTYDRWDNTDLDWSPRGEYIAFISQRSDADLFSNNICIVPAKGGQVTQLTQGEAANDRSPRWSPNGHTIAFVSNRSDDDDIWCVAADGSGLRRLTDGKGDKADPRWSPDGEWIAYTHFSHGDINIVIVPAAGGVPRRVVSGGCNTAPRWSPDGAKLLYHRSGYDQPGDLWVKSINADPSDPGRQITHCDLGMLQGIPFSKPQIVSYRSRDGLEIEGFLYRPIQASNQPGPAILWIHGGPNLAHTSGWYPSLQYLAQRGYTIFAPNYRGSLGYGKQFMEANIGPPIGADVDDWLAAAEILRNTEGVDRERVAIMGRSAGGYATLLALGVLPDEFQAGVCISGPSSWFSYWDETETAWTRRFRVKLMGLPATNQELYRRRSPITYAEHFRAPVLILHGEADYGVPSGQAREMAAELARLKKEHECFIYPEEGHEFVRAEAISDSIRHVERFLNQHLDRKDAKEEAFTTTRSTTRS